MKKFFVLVCLSLCAFSFSLNAMLTEASDDGILSFQPISIFKFQDIFRFIKQLKLEKTQDDDIVSQLKIFVAKKINFHVQLSTKALNILSGSVTQEEITRVEISRLKKELEILSVCLNDLTNMSGQFDLIASDYKPYLDACCQWVDIRIRVVGAQIAKVVASVKKQRKQKYMHDPHFLADQVREKRFFAAKLRIKQNRARTVQSKRMPRK